MFPEGEVAVPGSVDLDIDVDGITLTAVVILGREILLRGRGGFGWFVSTESEVAIMDLGEESGFVLEAHLVMPDGWQDTLARYVAKLSGWMERSVPLHLIGAPGRMFALIEDVGSWLPIPRRDVPALGG